VDVAANVVLVGKRCSMIVRAPRRPQVGGGFYGDVAGQLHMHCTPVCICIYWVSSGPTIKPFIFVPIVLYLIIY
jgi:hypothetical protein